MSSLSLILVWEQLLGLTECLDVQAAAAASVGPRHRPTAAERRAAGLATGRGGCRQRELGEDSL